MLSDFLNLSILLKIDSISWTPLTKNLINKLRQLYTVKTSVSAQHATIKILNNILVKHHENRIRTSGFMETREIPWC